MHFNVDSKAQSKNQGMFGSLELYERSVDITNVTSFSCSPCKGSVTWKSQELFKPEKPDVRLQSTCFEKLIF